MEPVFILLGLFVSYLFVGTIVACCMKFANNPTVQSESGFKTAVVLWPAPTMLGLMGVLIYIFGLPFGIIYRWTEKWKS